MQFLLGGLTGDYTGKQRKWRAVRPRSISGPDFSTLLASDLEASYNFYKEKIGLNESSEKRPADKPNCKKTGKNCPMNDNKECNCGKDCDCAKM